MMAVNFIPEARIWQRRRRTIVRRWTWVVTSLGAVVLFACGAAVTTVSATPMSAEQATLRQLQQENEQRRAREALVREEIEGLKSRLQIVRRITPQPDWSLLFALIVEAGGSDIVLTHATLSRTPEGPRLTLKGYGRTPSVVLDFVLQLEHLGLFETVKPVNSERTELLGGPAVNFELMCAIAEEVDS